jgi:hypothetical protein
MLTRQVSAVLASLLAASPLFAQTIPYFEEAKLTSPSPAASDYFGGSTGLSGDTSVIGAFGDDDSAGAVYVSVRTGTSWAHQAKLVASDALPFDHLGLWSVAIDGDTVLAGAPDDDNSGGTDAGAVYVFVRNGTNWTEQAKLVAADAIPNSHFGFSVSLSGNTALVGVNVTPSGSSIGSAYVFTRSEGGTWAQEAKVESSDGALGDRFGFSVALNEDTAVVSSPSKASKGAAYIFVRTGASWTEQSKIVNPDSHDNFGHSSAISGETVIIGKTGGLNQSGVFEGSAYLFVRNGSTWSLQSKITASDAGDDDHFGVRVSISGDIAVVGADSDDTVGGLDTGSAYVFLRDGSAWTQRAKLVASDQTTSDFMGSSVSVFGDTVVVGAIGDASYAGAAYAFRLVLNNAWSDLGLGMAGGAGVPTLMGVGGLQAGQPITLSLAKAKPFSLAPLVVGISTIYHPFKFGVVVPSPNFIFPLSTDFFGKAAFGGLWPAGVPSGFTTYFQWWIQDPAGPQGYAASNAVAGTAP